MSTLFPELVERAESGDASFEAVSWPDCVAAARDWSRQQRAEIERRHAAGESGADIVHALSDAADSVVRGVFSLCLHRGTRAASLRKRVALCALGGYGRRELSPQSDLDLCLLYKGRLDTSVEQLNRLLLPFLWDLGFRAGYALQDLSGAVKLCREDPEVFTAHAQARLLVGDPGTFEKLQASIAKPRAAITARLEDYLRQREHPEELPPMHADLYHPEPDLKDGAGGLRDYHAAQWKLMLHHGVPNFDALERGGRIRPEQHLECREGLDFLWRIRNELHFHTERPDNQLTFALQRHVAQAFGYGPGDPASIDRFMQDYYTAARRTRCFLLHAARLSEAGREACAADATAVIHPLRTGIAVHRGWVHGGMQDKLWFKENPPRLMEVYWECARRKLPLSHPTEQRVRENLHLVNDAFRQSELVRRFFLAICGRPLQAGFALRQAAESGLLGAYLPEFAAVQGIVRYEDFHSYPVDEHTLRALEALAGIPRLEGPVGTFLQRTLEQVHDPRILVLAILFHDLGKASGEEHVDEGIRLAHTIGARMGLSVEDTARVTFLVKHHMLMTHLSIYRDTDDPELVESFAEIMQGDARLRELLLLSYADLAAVGPGVWNDWKGALLLKLYLKAERILTGRAKSAEHEAFWARPKATEIRNLAPAELRDRVEDHLRALGPRYFDAFSPEHVARHLACLEQARRTGLAVECGVYDATGMSEIVICTHDKSGLFAALAGCFASQLVDIHSAQLFSTPDGYVVDCFNVREAVQGRPLSPAQIEGLKQALRAVLLEGQDVQQAVEQAQRRIFALRQPHVPTPPQVSFDNSASRTDTVIEVETGDRTGLLYDIGRAFAQHGVVLMSARIVTDARRVRDAFYVRMVDGKLHDERLQAVLRDALKEALLPLALAGTQGESA